MGKSVDCIRVSYSTGSAYTYINNFQIEEGTTASEYEPYSEENYDIYLDEPLRKVGEYSDTLDFISGGSSHVIGSKTFNGEEEWTKSSSTARTVRTIVNDYKVGSNLLDLLSSHFNVISSDTINDKDTRFGKNAGELISSSNLILYKYDGYTNQGEDYTLWKEWLKTQYNSGTPVELIYPLLTKKEQKENLPNILSIGMDKVNFSACDSKGVCASDIIVEYTK